MGVYIHVCFVPAWEYSHVNETFIIIDCGLYLMNIRSPFADPQSVVQPPTTKESVQPLEGKTGLCLTTPIDPPSTTPTNRLQTLSMDLLQTPHRDPLQTTHTDPRTTTYTLETMPADPSRITPTDPLLTTPTLHQLNQRVIRQIALDWYSVGLHLDIEALTLQIIEADIHPPSVERCCHTMFTRWLSHDEGTGGAPRLWRTVLKALKNVGYNTLVGDVERTLFEQN